MRTTTTSALALVATTAPDGTVTVPALTRADWRDVWRLARLRDALADVDGVAWQQLAAQRDALTADLAARGLVVASVTGQARTPRQGGLVDRRLTASAWRVGVESDLRRQDAERRHVRAQGVATTDDYADASGIHRRVLDYATASARSALRRQASGRSNDYAARLGQRDNVAGVAAGAVSEALTIGRALANGAQLPRGWDDAMAYAVTVYAAPDAVALASVYWREAYAPAERDALAWRLAYGSARRHWRDAERPDIPRDALRRALAYLVRRHVRIAPESGAPATSARLPESWQRVTVGERETGAPFTYLRASAGQRARYRWESDAVGHVRTTDARPARPGAVSAVTEYAEPLAVLSYVPRVAYAALAPLASGDATTRDAVEALTDAVRQDDSLRRALAAMVRRDGVASLYGTVLPADAVTSDMIGALVSQAP